MENVNWLKLKLNRKMMNLQSAKANINADLTSSNGGAKNLIQNTQNKIINQYQQQFVNPQQLRMNNLASIDRAVYVKNLLNLPKNMVELLVMVQNDGKMPNLQKPSAETQNNIQNQLQNAQNLAKNIQQNAEHLEQMQMPKSLVQNEKNLVKGEILQQQNFGKPNIQQNTNQQNIIPQNQPNIHNKPNIQHHHDDVQSNRPNSQQNSGMKNPQTPIGEKVVDNLSNAKNHIAENLNNIKENVQQGAERFVHDAKQNVRQNSILNPHNQLHNAVRNNIRNNIILDQQIAKDLDASKQLQANEQATKGMTPEELAQFKQNLASQLNANVNLTHVSALLQKNSKMAMNKMVSMMTMATAQGMTDVKPLQDTMNVISASVAATNQNDATQTLKNLMLLYLPWLPLQEGVGFNLEIEQDEDTPTSDTYIKILITTVNYGNLHATVSLVSGNSVEVAITCSEKFPKKELFKRLQKDGKQHSMQTVIDIKEQKLQEQLDAINPKAKVNLSNVNQVNPYLLLMSHAIIRHTIEIDATISIGAQPIDD